MEISGICYIITVIQQKAWCGTSEEAIQLYNTKEPYDALDSLDVPFCTAKNDLLLQ